MQKARGEHPRLFSLAISLWILAFYWLGVVFYDLLDSYSFKYADEGLLLGLFVLYGAHVMQSGTLHWRLVAILLTAIFYIGYSANLGLNSLNAILADCIVSFKPFVAFALIASISPRLSPRQLSLFRINAVLGGGLAFAISLAGPDAIHFFFGHPSRLATTATISGLLFLLSSSMMGATKNTAPLGKREIGVSILLFAIALASERAKAFAFFAVACGLLAYLSSTSTKPSNRGKGKRNIGLTLILAISIAIAALFAADKFEYYFVEGTAGSEVFARPAMYLTSLSLASDYFPFGSGLASFGTYYSAVYYSPIYSAYELDRVWGLSEDAPEFTSDTLLPALLGQFGVFGFSLLVYSTIRVFRAISRSPTARSDIFVTLLVFFIFLTIETFVDSTLIQNRGTFVLALLGLLYSHVNAK